MQAALNRLQQQEADNVRSQRTAQEASQVMSLASCMLLCLLPAETYTSICMVHSVHKAQASFGGMKVFTKCSGGVQAQTASQAEVKAVQAELQGATEMLDSMQQMASSSMEGQEEAQKHMDALTAQMQAAIQVNALWECIAVCYGVTRQLPV